MPLSNLIINASFLYGLFLIPEFSIEAHNIEVKDNQGFMIQISVASALSTIGLVCFAYAIKHGLGPRVQIISAIQMFMVLILYTIFSHKGTISELISGLGIALVLVSAYNLLR